MKHLFKHMRVHLDNHKHKYIGLAIFCKLMLVGLFAAIGIQAIQHSYAQETYIIKAWVEGEGGIISPSGEIQVPQGTNQTFTITPDTLYFTKDVLVGKESVGPVSSYTFYNVQTNNNITAIFEKRSDLIRIPIVVQNDIGGSTDPKDEARVVPGTNLTINFLADRGRGIQTIIDGRDFITPLVSEYTLSNITEQRTVEVAFGQLPKIGEKTVDCNPRETKATLHIELLEGGQIISADPLSNRTINGQAANFLNGAFPRNSPIMIDLGAMVDGSYELIIAAGTLINGLLTTEELSIPFDVACGFEGPVTYEIAITADRLQGTTDPEGMKKDSTHKEGGLPGPEEKLPGGEEPTTQIETYYLTVQGGDNQTIRLIPNIGFANDYIEFNTTTVMGASSITLYNINQNIELKVFFKEAVTQPIGGGGGGGGGGGSSTSYISDDGKTLCTTDNERNMNPAACLKQLLQPMADQLRKLNDAMIPVGKGQRELIIEKKNLTDTDENLFYQTLQYARQTLGQLNNDIIEAIKNYLLRNPPVVRRPPGR